MNKARIITGIIISVFLLNLFLPDIFYYLNQEEGNFNPVIGNIDYLRHHSAAHQLYEGRMFFSIYDNKFNHLPYMYAQPIPTVLYGILIFLFQNNMALTFFSALLIFSLISFFILRKFLENMVSSKTVASLISALALVAGNAIIAFPFLSMKQVDSILILHRIANPLIGYPLFFGMIYYAYRIFSLDTVRKDYVIAGILLGLLFHTYVYFWTFSLVLLGVVFLYKAMQARNILFKGINEWMIAAAYAAPFAILYGINAMLQYKIGIMDEWSARNSIMGTHELFTGQYDIFYMAAIGIIAVILGGLYYLDKTNFLQRYIFFSFLFIAGYASLYNNLITGMAVQKGHWFAFTIYPFIIVSGLILANIIVEKYIPKWNSRIVFLFAVLFIVTAHNAWYSSSLGAQDYEEYSVSNTEMEAYSWINENLPRDAKIVASPMLSRKIIGFTHADTLYLDILEKAGNEELKERNALAAMILGRGLTYETLGIPEPALDIDMTSLRESIVGKEELVTKYDSTHIMAEAGQKVSIPTEEVYSNEEYKILEINI